jgi:hypothetical protein
MNMKIWLCVPALAATVLAAQAQSYVEAMPNYAASQVYSSIYGSQSGPVGWTFQPTTDIDVTALGAFTNLVGGAGGFTFQVGLWDASGSLLASQTVNSASITVDQSKFADIAPLLLLASQTYYVAVYTSGSLVIPVGTPTMAPGMQLGQAATSPVFAFTFPSTLNSITDLSDVIIGPNFLFEPLGVPEPSACLLLSGGLAGVLALRRAVRCPATRPRG